jgi:hypothetical protein
MCTTLVTVGAKRSQIRFSLKGLAAVCTSLAHFFSAEMPATPSKRSGRPAARSPHMHPDLTEQHLRAVAPKKSAKISPEADHAPFGFFRVWMVIALFLIAGTALPVTIHTLQYGFSPLQASLAFFLVLNVLICFWEISLGLHITYVTAKRQNRYLL